MPIRTAILGYGRSGSSMHAGGVEASDAFTMTAVCDIDPKRRDEARERFGCPVYDDYDAMFEKEELDLVVIVTRSDQHCEMTCDALHAGVPVLVTKPWAVNAEEAEQMVAKHHETGTPLLPWLPSRWGTDLRRLRELVVDEEVIGNVFFIRRSVTSFGTRSDWQTEKRYGGGYLLNWGPHLIDPAVLLKGVEIRDVYARMQQTINPGDTEDVFCAMITLADGTLVQAEYTVGVTPLPDWYIQGDRGTIVVADGKLQIHRKTPARPDDPTKFQTMTAEDDSTETEERGKAPYGDTDEIYADIANALRGDAPYPVTPEDALNLSRLLDAIRESNKIRNVVTWPPRSLS